MTIVHWIAIFIGGGLGALTRAWVSTHSGVGQGIFAHIPLGTLWVNWGGSFLLGLLLGVLPSPTPIKVGLTTGFMGGLTTFSTLSIENAKLFQNHSSFVSALHLGLHCGGGLICAVVGLSLGATLCRE